MTPRAAGRRRDKGGFALVTVIWGVALIALLIVSYMSTARLRLQMAFNLAGAAQADLLAEAALNQTALFLLSERETRGAFLQPPASTLAERPVHDGAPRFCALAGAAAAISIEEESGKVDINAAPQKLLQSLLSGLGVAPRDADAIAAGIVAFRSPPLPNGVAGVEAPETVKSDKPFGLKRAPFQSIAELDQAPGVSPALYRLLSPLVTIYSRSPGVDARAAPPALLALLAGAPPDEIQSLIATPFPNALDRKDPRFQSGLQLNGDGGVFLAHVEIVVPSGQTSVQEAIFDFRDAIDSPFQLKELRHGRARDLPALRTKLQDWRAALPDCG
jgi:general secretion pathway protein K